LQFFVKGGHGSGFAAQDRVRERDDGADCHFVPLGRIFHRKTTRLYFRLWLGIRLPILLWIRIVLFLFLAEFLGAAVNCWEIPRVHHISFRRRIDLK
jgi:hypothetical protein